MSNLKQVKKSLPLVFATLLALGFFYFKLYHYLSFESLKQHRVELLEWKNTHYVLSVLLYIFCYTLAIAASLPLALIFSLSGGFLFGVFPGALYALFSATLGSCLLFLAVKLALAPWAKKKVGRKLKKVEAHFKNHAFHYLLSLRLIPIFPFWLANLIAGLLGLPFFIFFSATLLGLIPTVVIYTYLGSHLNILFLSNQAFSFKPICQPSFLIPLFLLALLALLPELYKRLK